MGGGASFRGQYTRRPAYGIPGARYVETPASDAAAKARLRAELRASLPVLGWLIGDDPRTGRPAPILHVGTKERPDVRDYLRVHRQDCPLPAEGDTWTQVYAVTGAPIGAPVLFVCVKTQRPARCAFSVALRFGRHDAPIAALAASGVLGIAVEPLRIVGGTLTTPSVLMEVSGRELVGTLVRAWQQRGGGR